MRNEIGNTGYYVDAVETKKTTGYAYKVSQCLMDNIIAKKEKTVDIEPENIPQRIISSSQQLMIDRDGKGVILTEVQHRLLLALAQVVDPMLDDEGVKRYILQLPSHIEDRQISQDGGYHERLPNSLRCVIDIQKLAKEVNGTKRVGGSQADMIRTELNKLSELRQVYKISDGDGGTYTIESPLISIGKAVRYERNGTTKYQRIELIFEDIFVYEIKERYSLIPKTLLELYNSTGVRNQLVMTILLVLLRMRGNHVSHANREADAKRKDLRKKKLSNEEIETEIKKIKREALTYQEKLSSIIDRLNTKKYVVVKKQTGRSYINKTKLNKDLSEAVKALKHIGIITDYYETIGASGDKICNFVFNETWLSDERQKMQQILAPLEA